jgi:hemoglobin-like flavoprotein
MTTVQILAVKRSWRALQGINPQLIGDIFYSKLFADAPQLRKMFPKDMKEQNQKLIDMLASIVMRLDRPDELTDDIAAMAKRHAGYGVVPKHYELVGAALLWTLQKGLGRDWTPEVSNAWIACYTMLSNTMIEASGYSEKMKLA